MLCGHRFYHFIVVNTRLTALLSHHDKTKLDSKMIQFMPANHSITNVLAPNLKQINYICREGDYDIKTLTTEHVVSS